MCELKLSWSSTELGYNRAHFNAIKVIHPERYNKILSFEGVTMYEKYIKFSEWVSSISDEFIEIGNTVDMSKRQLSILLYEAGIYGHPNTYSNTWYIPVSHNSRLSSILRREKVIDFVKELRNDRAANTEKDNNFTTV